MRTLLSGLLGLVFGFIVISWYIGANTGALYSNGNCLVDPDTIELPAARDVWFQVVNPLKNDTYELKIYRDNWGSFGTTLVISRKEVESRFMKVDCPRQPIPGE